MTAVGLRERDGPIQGMGHARQFPASYERMPRSKVGGYLPNLLWGWVCIKVYA